MNISNIAFVIGFNYVYQDGMIFKPPYNRDDNNNDENNNDNRMNEIIAHNDNDDNNNHDDIIISPLRREEIKTLAQLPNEERIKLIAELMTLEYEYSEMLILREDDCTQSYLMNQLALYYYRLFKEPLHNEYLLNERLDILNSFEAQNIFHMKRPSQIERKNKSTSEGNMQSNNNNIDDNNYNNEYESEDSEIVQQKQRNSIIQQGLRNNNDDNDHNDHDENEEEKEMIIAKPAEPDMDEVMEHIKEMMRKKFTL